GGFELVQLELDSRPQHRVGISRLSVRNEILPGDGKRTFNVRQRLARASDGDAGCPERDAQIEGDRLITRLTQRKKRNVTGSKRIVVAPKMHVGVREHACRSGNYCRRRISDAANVPFEEMEVFHSNQMLVVDAQSARERVVAKGELIASLAVARDESIQ